MRYAVVALALVLASCAHHDDQGVLGRAREAGEPAANGGLSIAAKFEKDKLLPVGAGGQQFAIRSREEAMEKFPCQRCHNVPLARIKHDGKDGKAKAHWNVKLQHAPESVMSCATCHDPADTNRLRTVAGAPVAVDRSHQVCSQCHSRQAADWAGGAHGKRLGGWAPPRVAKTCVECHNPHTPAWDRRIPVHVALTGVAGGEKR